MVIAFSALSETRDTLSGLVSLILAMVTRFKKEEVKTSGINKMWTETVNCYMIVQCETF